MGAIPVTDDVVEQMADSLAVALSALEMDDNDKRFVNLKMAAVGAARQSLVRYWEATGTKG